MRTRGAEWFEIKIRYERENGDGSKKKVTEAYVVEASFFSEAEDAIEEELSSYISGEFTVTNISKASYKEIVFSDNPDDDRWYKTKVQFIIIDEKSGKEKFTAANYLVQGDSVQNSIKNLETAMNVSMQDWRLAAVKETTLVDVFEHTNIKQDEEE